MLGYCHNIRGNILVNQETGRNSHNFGRVLARMLSRLMTNANFAQNDLIWTCLMFINEEGMFISTEDVEKHSLT